MLSRKANSMSPNALSVPIARRSLLLDLQQAILRRMDRLAERFGRKSRLPAHLQIGIRGEEEALFFLRRNGYTIVARRWSTPKLRGDVDLIAWHNDWLCFVEVKSRTARDLYPAKYAVDPDKQERLRRLARVYLKGFPQERRKQILVRFDVVSVYLIPSDDEGGKERVECELIESAFPRWEEPREQFR